MIVVYLFFSLYAGEKMTQYRCKNCRAVFKAGGYMLFGLKAPVEDRLVCERCSTQLRDQLASARRKTQILGQRTAHLRQLEKVVVVSVEKSKLKIKSQELVIEAEEKKHHHSVEIQKLKSEEADKNREIIKMLMTRLPNDATLTERSILEIMRTL